jgi:protein-ribulosamine 3-kinase
MQWAAGFTMQHRDAISILAQNSIWHFTSMVNDAPEQIRDHLSIGIGCRIISFSFSGGGCINHGGKLETSQGTYFLKWNDRQRFPGMFKAEAKGLQLLSDSNSVRVPKVIRVGEVAAYQYLLLEFISTKTRTHDYWVHFGVALANLHLNTSEKFGLDHSNYIGSLVQQNHQSENWIDFFVQQRLNVQLERATENNLIGKKERNKFEQLFKKLPTLLPDEKPSLLHGDLWGGNLMADEHGLPCLIDPAVYFGHREADLAMSFLFGGFDSSYLDSYNEVFPLMAGYEARFNIYNLYSLMVHLNLFGRNYLPQVVSILDDVV